jgi:hypothetical protein
MHVRDKETPIRAADEEQFSPEFLAAGLMEMRESLGRLARVIENRSHPVDEYNTATLSGGVGVGAIVNLLPTYDQMNEKIIAAIVAGPPAASVTLVLGDRNIPMVIPAAGIIPVGPMGMILGRNDPRQLIAATPGAYFLELMGWADRRYNI